MTSDEANLLIRFVVNFHVATPTRCTHQKPEQMKQASLYTDEAGIGLHNSATIRNTDEFQRPHNFTE